MSVEYRTTRIVEAPAEDVFAAWTDAQVLARWFGPGTMRTPDVELDPRPGGVYRFAMRDDDGSTFVVGGTFREVDRPRRLQFTWRWESGVPHTFESLVTINLVELDDYRTELTLVHDGFPDPAAAASHERGWEASLPKLQAVFA